MQLFCGSGVGRSCIGIFIDNIHLNTVCEASLTAHNHCGIVGETVNEFVAGAETLTELHFHKFHFTVFIEIDIFVAGAGLLHDSAVGDNDVVG